MGYSEVVQGGPGGLISHPSAGPHSSQSPCAHSSSQADTPLPHSAPRQLCTPPSFHSCQGLLSLPWAPQSPEGLQSHQLDLPVVHGNETVSAGKPMEAWLFLSEIFRPWVLNPGSAFTSKNGHKSSYLILIELWLKWDHTYKMLGVEGAQVKQMGLAVGSSEVSSIHEGDVGKRRRPAPRVTSHCLFQ